MEEYKSLDYDLSYSGIVDKIQGDKYVAKQMLINIACDLEIAKSKKSLIEDALKKTNDTIDYLQIGVERILNHINIEKTTIITKDSVITITSDNVNIERNLL